MASWLVCYKENVELDGQLWRKEAELAEVQGQLTQKVNCASFVWQFKNPCSLFLQEELLQCSEREKQIVVQQLQFKNQVRDLLFTHIIFK